MDKRSKRAETIESLENTGRNVWDLELGNGFLDMASKAQAIKEKKNIYWT